MISLILTDPPHLTAQPEVPLKKKTPDGNTPSEKDVNC